MATSQENGHYGESYIYNLLKSNDIPCSWAPYGSGYDFITNNGTRLEIKYGSKRKIEMKSKKKGLLKLDQCVYNLHHHNKKQLNIDFFIFLQILDELNQNILIIPANLLRGKTFVISERQQERKKYEYFNQNWSLIKQFDLQLIAEREAGK